jgi:hypothetical protein
MLSEQWPSFVPLKQRGCCCFPRLTARLRRATCWLGVRSAFIRLRGCHAPIIQTSGAMATSFQGVSLPAEEDCPVAVAGMILRVNVLFDVDDVFDLSVIFGRVGRDCRSPGSCFLN